MKLGVALSGGGIRGIAHAGVLKALEENDIKIDIIGGTSSGGIIATLYAMGYSPYHIYILFKRHAKEIAAINSGSILKGFRSYVMNQKIDTLGLSKGDSLEEKFDQIAAKKGIKKMKDIKMPIVVPTVDIANARKFIFTNKVPKGETEKEKYITNINVGKAIRATSSFPAIFCPVEFDSHMFIDGGALDNIPVEEVKKQGAQKILAVNFIADKVDKNSNIMDTVMKSIDIMGSKISEDNLKLSDYVLTVPTDKTGLLDIQKLDSCYNYGYEAVIKNLDKIKNL